MLNRSLKAPWNQNVISLAFSTNMLAYEQWISWRVPKQWHLGDISIQNLQGSPISPQTSASHHIFCPIKCSLESKVPLPMIYTTWPKRLLTRHVAIWVGDIYVFGCSNAQVLFHFPTVRWLRMKWLKCIHSSTIESNISSALGFASMVLSSTTCSQWGTLNAVGYLKMGRSNSTCPALASCFSGSQHIQSSAFQGTSVAL